MALDIEYVKERHIGRWIAITILIIALAAAGWFAYKWYTTGSLPVTLPIASANGSIDETEVSAEAIESHTVAVNEPRYISVPSIDLDMTRIYPAGLDASNFIEAPANIYDVSWYKTSGTPGDGGVILMQGHSTGVNNNGAFARLSELKKGDTVTLTRGDDEKFVYKVIENQSMSIEEVNATGMKLMGQSAEPGTEALNLMTYDGAWVPRLGTFDRRTLVRTILNEN